MIPLAFLKKMGNYQIRMGDAEVTVNVIKHHSLVTDKLTELKNQSLQRRVVGIDAESSCGYFYATLRWLILCVENRCLVIDLRVVNPIPESLKSFLADQTICFVGITISATINNMRLRGMECKTGVELANVAAQVLKMPNLQGTSLEVLLSAVGLKDQVDTDLGKCGNKNSAANIDWSAEVFSEEEMPRVVRDPYYSNVVGDKVLGML